MAKDENTSHMAPKDVSTLPIIGGHHTFSTISDKIAAIVLTPGFHWGWLLALLISFGGLNVLLISLTWLVWKGIGIWGVNIPVAWGFAIVNFVWWIGIGHAGTLISAILLLFKQTWRTSINRFAEAMTIFAVMCAGIFPALHTGRPWYDYWLFPYPGSLGLWPQFRSPLMWDVFAVSTYFTVSLLFWFVGLVPDFATLRDQATKPIQKFLYGIFSLGWRGSTHHWKRYETAYMLLAGLATPLVLSVHSVVSFDFAVGQVPGWHTTIFPPYFVAGAIYSGFAMVLTLAIPFRKFYQLNDFITDRHLNNMAKVMLCTGLIVTYGYAMEAFSAFYSGNEFERYMMVNRMSGPYAPVYWTLILCNCTIPQLLWVRRIRHNVAALFILSLVIQLGMWTERFIIVITSLHRDFLPSSWGMYYPSFWDIATFLGTIGMFTFFFLLFARYLPMISIAEMKMLLHEEEHHKKGGHHG